MDKFRYRSMSRFIAFVDMVFASIVILYPLITIILFALSFAERLNDRNFNPHQGFLNPGLVLMIIVVIILNLQLVAAVKLIKATRLEICAVGAAKRARFWRNATMTLVVPVVLMGVMLSEISGVNILFLATLLNAFVRCICIYIVHQHVLELDAVAASPASPTSPDPIFIISIVQPSTLNGPTIPVCIPLRDQPNQADLLPPAYDQVVKEKI